ncbi:ABC transporter permease [Nocardioides albus]|uniref:NitT/TauT family transport system permease protein/taurine transport system permease protein n=1 Tax=Nocardioides albus TaxID=1841 RepID=A0A7W5A4K1_9ACTN|nr:ABC transporter permease [Nocardioides albus]MBB3089300.1 NitT/TauT family transport system permease protein/taurine transport system permease protein [Nocardioides albus]GGU12902.1 ABC transporter permease [Nocardioides albus]
MTTMTPPAPTRAPARVPLLRRLGTVLLAHPIVRTLGPFVPFLLIWWAVAATGSVNAAFFAGPGEVWQSFTELVRKGMMPSYLGDSLERLAYGVGFGLLIGLPLGFVVALSSWARRLTWPLLLFFQAIADIAWLPILIVWFGFSLTSVTFVIVYTVVFPLMLGIVAGVDQVPRELVNAARSLGAGRLRVFFEVIVPGSLPAVASGVRTGLGYGWRALIAAEIIVGTSGIGFMMFDARRAGEVSQVFLGMIVLGVLWYALDALILAPFERATVERWGLVRQMEAAR